MAVIMGLGEGVFSLLIIGCVEVGAAASRALEVIPPVSEMPRAPPRLDGSTLTSDIPRLPPPPTPSRRSIVFLGACHLSRGTLQAAYVLPRVVLVPRRAFAACASRPF